MSATSDMVVISQSPDETQRIAALLAEQCKKGDLITLQGDLGAGKTCFAQGFIKELTGHDNVQSPTFLLIKSYESTDFPTVYHMDFYRIEHEGELVELGLDEIFPSGISLIEWPEIAQKHLPNDYLSIMIENVENDARKITFLAKGDWQERLNNIHLLPC